MLAIANPLSASWVSHDRLWLVEICIGLAVLILLNFLLKRGIQAARHRSLSRISKWQEDLDYILHTPFHILLWILGITLVVQILEKRFDFSFFGSYINAFRSTALIFCVSWGLLRWKNVLQKRLLTKDLQNKKIDLGLAQVIGKLLSIVIILLSGMLILEIWGMNIAPLLAFGGIGAAAIGFSAKDVLANFFGGMMLHINRPFVIGDFIHLPSQQIEGYVEEIGWNTTTLRDRDKRPLYLPNATFSSALVINGSRMTHRRIYEKLSIPYTDFSKLSSLIKTLKHKLESHPDVDRYLPIIVVLNGFENASITLLLDLYTLKTRYDEYLLSKQTLLMLVYQEIQEADIQLSSPSLYVTGHLSSKP